MCDWRIANRFMTHPYTYVVLLLGYVLDAVCGFVSIFWGNVFEVFV